MGCHVTLLCINAIVRQVKSPPQARLGTIVDRLRKEVSASGLTQAEFAKKNGVSQSCISRLMQPERTRVRMTEGLRRLCINAGISLESGSVDPRAQNELMSALGRVWDGTPAHARRVARVLRALGDL